MKSAQSWIDKLSSVTGISPEKETFRRDQADLFLTCGWPRSQQEPWKFLAFKNLRSSEVSPLLEETSLADTPIDVRAEVTFRNGQSPTEVGTLPKGISLQPIEDLEPNELSALLAKVGGNAFWHLAGAFWNGGSQVVVKGQQETPWVIRHQAHGSEQLGVCQSVHQWQMAERSQATIVELFDGEGSYWRNHVQSVVLQPGSDLTWVRVHKDQASSFHSSLAHVEVKEGAKLRVISICLGEGEARNEFKVDLLGEDAEAGLWGVSAVSGTSIMDHHITVAHRHPQTQSNQTFRNVLTQKATAVFDGGVTVEKDAQDIEAHQINRNLLLSDDAKVQTVPRLEILADRVKCSHGATVGKLDDDQVFYLRSRGLSESAARQMLVESFLKETLDVVEDVPLREALEKAMASKVFDMTKGS